MNINNSGNSSFSQLRLFSYQNQTNKDLSEEVNTSDEVNSSDDESISSENDLLTSSITEKDRPLSLVPSTGLLTAEEIQKFSFLNKTYPISFDEPLDLTIFAHIAASSFVGNSIFEGSKPIHSINTLKELINSAILNPFIRKLTPQLNNLFDDCQRYENEINDILSVTKHEHKNDFDLLPSILNPGLLTQNDMVKRNEKLQKDALLKIKRKELLNNFACKVMNDVLNLPIGKKIFFPGGWSGLFSGHFLVYIFEKIDENKFSFTVINTGEGLIYHTGSQDRKTACLKFEHINKENLTLNFFEPLVGLRFYSMWTTKVKDELSSKVLYELILPTLGTPTAPTAISSLYDIRPQRSGTCSMKALLETIRYIIHENAEKYNPDDLAEKLLIFKLFRIDIQRLALIKTCLAYFKPNVPYNRNAHKLINEANKVLSKSVWKYSANINAEDQKSFLATIQDISNRLKVKKMTVSRTLNHISYDKVNFKGLFDSLFTGTIKFNKNLSLAHLFKQSKKATTKKFKIPVLNQISPLEIVNFLQAWSNKNYILNDSSFDSDRLLIVSDIMIQLKKLPVPLKQAENFWNKIPHKNIESCLNGLFNISKILFRYNSTDLYSLRPYKLDNSKSLKIEIANILAIADFLARQIEENQLSEFPIYSDHILNFAKDPKTRIYDPLDQLRLKKLEDYFQITGRNENYPKEMTLFCLNNNNLIVNKENLSKYKELQFYKSFVEDFKIKSSIRFQSLDEYILYIAIEGRLNKQLIPKSVLFLKNISYFSQLIDNSIFNSITAFANKNINFEFCFSKEYSNINKQDIQSILRKQDNQSFLQIASTFNDIDCTLILTEKNRTSIGNIEKSKQFEKYLTIISQNSIMSSEYIKDEKLLIHNVNKNDEIVRVLAYINKCSKQTLENKDVQNVIESHFFRYKSLFYQIINEPQSSKKIIENLEIYIDYFKLLKKWDTCLFFIQMASMSCDFIKKIKNLNPFKFSSIDFDFFKDYRQWAINEILPKLEKMEDFNRLYTTLVKIYLSKKQFIPEDEFNVNFAIDFYTLNILTNIQKNTDENSLDDINFSLFNLQQINQIELQMQSNIRMRNRILNGIAKVMINKDCDFHWEGTSKLFKAFSYTIDLNQFIFTGNHQFQSFVNKKEMDFIHILKSYNIFDNIQSIEYLSEKEAYIYDTNGKTYIRKEDNQLLIQRQIKGIDCKFITLYENSIIDREILPFFTQKQISIWKIIGSQDYLFYHAQGRIFFVEGTSLCHSTDKSEIFTMQISKISDNILFDNVLLNHKSLINHEILIKFVDFNSCNSLNVPKLLFWSHISNLNIINKIEMFDLNLIFTLQKDKHGEDQYFSREYTGFYLSSNQMKHLRKKWPSFLVLENENREMKILMHKYDTIIDKSDFEGVNYKEPNENEPEIFTYIVLKVDGKIRLKPDCIAGAVNLITLLLSTKRFNQAIETIDYCRSVREYTQSENDILVNFFKTKHNAGSHHPLAIIVRLKLAIVALENRKVLKNVFETSNFFKKLNLVSQNLPPDIDYNLDVFLCKYYIMYLQNINNTNFKLKVHEEEFILNYLLKTYINSSSSSPLNLDHLNSGNNYFKIQKTFVERLNFLNGNNTITKKTVFNIGIKSIYKKANLQQQLSDFNEYFFLAHFKYYFKRFNSVDNSDLNIDITNSNFQNSCYKLPYYTPSLDSSAPLDFAKNAKILMNKIVVGKKNPDCNIDFSEKLNEADIFWDELIKKLTKSSISLKQKIYEKNLRRLEDLKKKLVVFANGNSFESTFKEELKARSTLKQKLNFSKILELFEKGSRENYQQNTFLSVSEIDILDNQVALYLLESTRCAQLKRIIQLQSEYVINQDNDEKKILTNQLEMEFKSKREYSFSLNRTEIKEWDDSNFASFKRKRENESFETELKVKKHKKENGSDNIDMNFETFKNDFIRSYLVVEFRNNLLLRKIQIEAFKCMEKNSNISEKLFDIGTGSGKSMVLAPLFQRIRQKNKFVFNLWPQSLYQTNKEDMKNILRNSFGQIAYAFEFDRSSDISINALLKLNKEFADAWNQNKQINTTPESLQCFELKFLEVLNMLSEGNTLYNLKTLMYMRFILHALYNSEFHIDEGHINLSPLKEVNFTLGTPKGESSNRIHFVRKIFEFLSLGKADEILGFSEDKQRFTTEEQVKEVLTDLALHFLMELDVSSENIPSYLNFVFTGQAPLWMYGHAQEELFVLLQQYIHKLLPVIFEKSVNVNFGLSRANPHIQYAKPYHGNDAPIENADYENVHETLAKTFITYLFKGLSFENLKSIIVKWQNAAKKESNEKGISLNKTEAFVKFQDYIGDKEGNLFEIDQNETLFKKIFEINKFSKKLILYFVADSVAPTILKYPQKIRSTSQDLMNMSNGKNLILTATPGRIDFYRSNLETISIGSGSKDVVNKLLSDECPIHVMEKNSPLESLQFCIEKLKDDFRMLIDIGAHFKGLSNSYIAQTLLNHFKNDPEIKGIVFFEENDQIMVLRINTNDILPIHQSGLKPRELFTYCDQRHAFGTDTKQFSKAKALITFDLNNTLDEVKQAVGRLRQFLQGQKVEWAMNSKTKNLIIKEKPIKICDLLDHAESNQQEQEIENCIRSLHQQITQEIRKIFMRKLIFTQEQDFGISYFKLIKDFIFESVDFSFKLPKQIEKSIMINPLELYMVELKEKIKALPENILSFEDKKTVFMKLMKYTSKIKSLEAQMMEISKKRSKPLTFSILDMETEVQNQVEIKNETKNELQQHSYIDSLYQNLISFVWPKDFCLFDQSWPKENLFYNEENRTQVPLCNFSKLFKMHAEQIVKDAYQVLLKPSFLDIFEESYHKILLTGNFTTIEPFKAQKLFTPLAKQQKSIYEILIIEETIDNKCNWTVIVGDQSIDAEFWRKKLVTTSKNTATNCNRRICLYDLSFGIAQSSPIPFTDEELMNNRDLQRLITKIKLFNGDLLYTEIQRQIILELADSKKSRKILKGFFERVIIWKSEESQQYKGSWLESILTD